MNKKVTRQRLYVTLQKLKYLPSCPLKKKKNFANLWCSIVNLHKQTNMFPLTTLIFTFFFLIFTFNVRMMGVLNYSHTPPQNPDT